MSEVPLKEARYKQISRELIEDIADGTYPPGAQLPTELELSRRFQVNRHTVREAIRALREDGLVFSIRGKGNFVSTTRVVYRLSDKVRFTQNILESNLIPGARLIDWSVVSADEVVAGKLQLETGESVLRLNILRLVNNLPFSVSSSYLPEQRFAALPDLIEGSFSLYGLLQTHYQIDPQRSESLIETRLPKKDELHHLRCSPKQPLLIVKSVACDSAGARVEYVVTRTRGDLGCLAIDFDQCRIREADDE